MFEPIKKSASVRNHLYSIQAALRDPSRAWSAWNTYLIVVEVVSHVSGCHRRPVGRYPGPASTESRLIRVRSALLGGDADTRPTGQ